MDLDKKDLCMRIFYEFKNIFEGIYNLLKFKLYHPYRQEQELLFKKRLTVCESCKFLNPKLRQCKKCGCFVDAKTKVTYKTDKDGLAIAYIDPYDNEVLYACPKKYW